MARHIVSIHAHPDDAEILAGGTLAHLAARGHRITIVTMTPGDKGSDSLGPEAVSEVRRGEARRAAGLIGATYLCAEFRDLEIFNDNPSRYRVVELLRLTKPDILLTSAPSDYLCDHEMTSVLVRDACFGAPCPNYITASSAIAHIPHLYFMDPIGGEDREGNHVAPHFTVNIEATFQTKWNMLAAHESQRSWLRRQHGMDNYMDTMTQWSRKRGAQAGFEYGEGFRHYKGHPYPESPLLQELLAGLVTR